MNNLHHFPPIEPNTPESIADRAVNRLFNGRQGNSLTHTREELRALLTAIQYVALLNCRPQLAICTGEDKTIHVHELGQKFEVCE